MWKVTIGLLVATIVATVMTCYFSDANRWLVCEVAICLLVGTLLAALIAYWEDPPRLNRR